MELLKRIVAEPDNVDLRRVYGDELLSRNDPRGLFIQVQCELAAAEPGSARYDELKATEQDLLKRYWRSWKRPAVGQLRDFEFVRGFIEGWDCPAQSFLTHGARLAASTPLRRVGIRNPDAAELRELLAMPALQGLEELALTQVAAEPIEPLAALGRFTRLERLTVAVSFGQPQSRGRAFDALVAAPWFERLTALRLYVSLDDDDIGALERSPVMQRLETLELRSWWSNPRPPIADMPSLRSLLLTVGHTTKAPIQLLRRAPKLERLALEFAGAMPRWPLLLDGARTGLDELRLTGAVLSDEIVTEILRSATRRLSLLRCAVTAANVERLRARFGDVLINERSQQLEEVGPVRAFIRRILR